MQGRSSVAARILSAILGLAFGLFAAELSFGQLRPADVPKPPPVLYSIEVRDQAGALLASPLLVGEENQPVHLDLSRESGLHSEPLAMSLDLDPSSAGGDNLCLGYRVRIDDGFPHSGRVATAYGEERSVAVTGGQGEPFRLSLVVAKARTPAFDKLLLARRKPSA